MALRTTGLLFFLFFSVSKVRAQALYFYVEDKRVAKKSLEELKAMVKSSKVTLEYHFSKADKKHYLGLPIKPLFQKIFGAYLKQGYTEVVFEATDGYQAFSEVKTVLTPGGVVAYKDLDVSKGWQSVGRRKVSPGPYFLVWRGSEQTTANNYPWPWAMKTVRLVKFGTRYPKVFPKGMAKTRPAFKGYETFKAQCFRCHAIDKQGGKIGPDLGAPKNILTYRTEKFFRAFVKRPETFRYSKMPPHPHLSKEDMENLLAYFRFLKKR